ncbi:MAG: DUF420 domain-containing protein [SAR324 cluster bacterium]|nr:DUF420 domain-containing protein [SAR324 cluster bacterium]
MNLTDLPALNAFLNGITFCLLIMGFQSIKAGNERRHKNFMLAACGVSALFLISYSIYHANVGSVAFQGTGVVRLLYFIILIPHIVLAALQVPLILIAVYKALGNDRVAHKKLVKWAFPIWCYVSVSGVIIYLMLYQMPE